jgi:hypothetical protein
MSNDFKDTSLRRNRFDMLCPAELSIHSAISSVESLGCSVKLTEAVNKLIEAKELVADYIAEFK